MSATRSKESYKEARKVLQLKITLQGIKPPIWRRVLVIATTLLPDLHKIIQTTMGWSNTHLHQFIDSGVHLGHPDLLEDPDVTDYRKMRIGEFIVMPRDSLMYEYDFGDDWKHKIVMEKAHAVGWGGRRYPFCLDGARACPPEDCGGIPGYMHMLEILADPTHGEYEEIQEWLDEPFDPEFFSQDQVNATLRESNFGVYDYFS